MERHDGRRGGGCVGFLAGIALLVLLLLLLGAFTGYGLGIGVADATVTEQKAVPVSGTATLDISNQVGSVTIQPSTDGSLSYTAVKHGWSVTSATAQSEADRMKVTVNTNGNNVTIKGEQAAGLLRFNIGNQNTIDLTVNVPSGSIVKVIINAGKATATSPDGALNITANAGSIEVSGAKLNGPLALQANAGEVKFSGSLAASGGTVQANAGSVTMSLDPTAKYNFNVKSDVGSVESNFSVPNGVQRAGTGATLIGDTDSGSGTPIPLKVTANAGSVKVNQAK